MELVLFIYIYVYIVHYTGACIFGTVCMSWLPISAERTPKKSGSRGWAPHEIATGDTGMAIHHSIKR